VGWRRKGWGGKRGTGVKKARTGVAERRRAGVAEERRRVKDKANRGRRRRVEGAEHLSSEAPLNLSALKRKIRLRLRSDDVRTATGDSSASSRKARGTGSAHDDGSRVQVVGDRRTGVGRSSRLRQQLLGSPDDDPCLAFVAARHDDELLADLTVRARGCDR
jgi:hypothetical protein